MLSFVICWGCCWQWEEIFGKGMLRDRKDYRSQSLIKTIEYNIWWSTNFWTFISSCKVIVIIRPYSVANLIVELQSNNANVQRMEKIPTYHQQTSDAAHCCNVLTIFDFSSRRAEHLQLSDSLRSSSMLRNRIMCSLTPASAQLHQQTFTKWTDWRIQTASM